MTKITEKKIITYLIASATTAMAFFFMALALGYLPIYLFFWATFGAVLGSCVSRVILHIVYKDYSPEMWQVAIYHAVTAVGVLGLIYSNTWGWASASAAIIVGMGLMATGTRFLDQNGGTLKLYRIENEVRYYPVDDDPEKEEDTARPICLYDGKALTIREAMEAKLDGAAVNARTRLAAIYGIKLEKEEK